jgi:hypothetical protein
MRKSLLIGALAAIGIGAALWRSHHRHANGGGGDAAHTRFPEDPGQPREKMTPDQCVDLASEDSFPASDPPSYTMSRAGRPAK